MAVGETLMKTPVVPPREWKSHQHISATILLIFGELKKEKNLDEMAEEDLVGQGLMECRLLQNSLTRPDFAE